MNFPIAYRPLIAGLIWFGLAHSSSAQGLGIGLHLGGLGVGVSIGSTSTSTNTGGLSVNVNTPVGSVSAGTGGTDATISVLGQQATYDAVSSHRAVPLETVLARVRLFTTGEVVDARLINYEGFLLYNIKVLETTGDVSELYFYARSGEQVQTN